MTGLMHAVYQALGALPCGISRAWPQAAQPLPALTFSLTDWQGGSDGTARAQLKVSLRTALPEEADDLAHQAMAALDALGLRLAAARDEAEADSGAFLKNLVFEGTLQDGLPQHLAFSVMDSDAWVAVAGLVETAFTPGERAYRDIGPLSREKPVYAAGGITPAALKVTVLADALDPGQQAISRAFRAGTPIAWRLEGGAYVRLGEGLVTALSDQAPEFMAKMMIQEE